MTQTGAPARAGRREWIGFGVLMLPLLLVSMDVSVLYFAVPFISEQLRPSASQQLWIFDIYGFMLAGLLITMGALGDRIGRRRLLLLGAVAFGGASLLAAYADSAAALIAARAVLGVGGATLMPSTLALIRNMFHDEKQRGTAVGIWTAAMTSGVALGPVLSGVLLEHFWWGSVFLINIPAMLLLLLLAPVLVPEFRNPAAGRFDLLGAALSLGALLPVIYGIKEAARDGWTPARGAAVALGVLLGVAFVVRQRTARHPMVDLALFRRRAFSGALGVNLLAMFGLVGFAIFTTQHLQSVLGLSPLRAALWSLVPALAVGGVAPAGTALAQRIDRAWLIAVGFVVAAGGFTVLTRVTPNSALWLLLLGAAGYAAGLVLVMSLVTELVLGAAPPERAGVASALTESSSELGGALGMAVLGSVGAAVYHREVADGLPAGLPGGAVATARETLGGALAVADGLPAAAGAAVLRAARLAFTDGLHSAAVVAALVMLAAAVVAAAVLRGARLPAPAESATVETAPAEVPAIPVDARSVLAPPVRPQPPTA
ncbi:MFS transporter [Micromonospora mirobrigensis]|uniref:MFS transporter, DHA2 family, multidrug resistance protein n=1 Tax=Micromonospora mirobrigensis TaxID=262898 RepID=A0A1C4ZCX8_9ACTN|nr:MFS transporter [Micromonospora mirobrigensis]SCF30696.1 MFS transporter, DHA2 family, multidrug resistance protein [Micromonospora mirobrigensis]